jgi:hypothetical protein
MIVTGTETGTGEPVGVSGTTAQGLPGNTSIDFLFGGSEEGKFSVDFGRLGFTSTLASDGWGNCTVDTFIFAVG